MSELQMGVVETRFAEMIWQNEPMSSAELAKQAEAELKWKKTTSYTVLKRLCDKGIFQNKKGTVTSFRARNISQCKAKGLLTRPSVARCPPFWPPLPRAKA